MKNGLRYFVTDLFFFEAKFITTLPSYLIIFKKRKQPVYKKRIQNRTLFKNTFDSPRDYIFSNPNIHYMPSQVFAFHLKISINDMLREICNIRNL